MKFALEMRACDKLGISHSAFLRWSDEDRGKYLAYILEESERCGQCGTAEWEWEEDRFAYQAQERVCLGCYNKEFVEEGSERERGKYVVLVKPER